MPERIVTVPTGSIRGETAGGVSVFRGIPYAAAPVGGLRFRPPQAAEPWTGVRDATRFGPTAPKGGYPEFARPLLPEVDIPGQEYLNLNVWAPSEEPPAASAAPSAAPRPDGPWPVLVWIHGGSFTNGSGSVPEYDGSAFARDGVVCVTINYRLGAEGFLLLGDDVANLGLLDMVAALTWVRDNIAAFGGDPARVALAGESAGAMAIGPLLAMPAARGQFAGAILQSGAAANAISAADAERVAAWLAADLGVPATRDGLAQVPVDTLVAAGYRVAREVATHSEDWGRVALQGLPLAPVIDGRTLPGAPLDHLIFDGPLLAGSNRDESRLFFLPSGALAQMDDVFLEASAHRFGLSPQGLAVYRQQSPDASPGDVFAAVDTDRRFRRPAIDLAEAAPRAWLYRFDGVPLAANDGLGSCHTAEVPFVFGTTGLAAMRARLGPDPSPACADLVHRTWVEFVTRGEPGWPGYDTATRTTALLGDRLEVVSDPQPETRLAW